MPNKDKEYKRKWREANKEKISQKQKEWYEDNKEQISQKHKEYREANKEKISQKQKEWYQTPNGKKMIIISKWKQQGIICDYEAIYDIYVETTKCDYCNKVFKSTKDRHLDHNHDTGEVRGILCQSCNIKDVYSELRNLYN